MDEKRDHDLEQAFSRYYQMLYKISVIMLCNEHDAYDAVQETFVRFLEFKGEFQDDEHEKAWLIRVNINVCKNFLRFHKLHPMENYEDLTLKYHTEEEVGLMDELFQLSEKYKEVLILHYIEGYTNAEIADILQISESAVKKRLERARIELRNRYNGKKKE
ncbi:MAG: RNA polymerase sigma factor [Blautia sp.]|nr:RNA polymerase sigma factor [Blautia sp.]